MSAHNAFLTFAASVGLEQSIPPLVTVAMPAFVSLKALLRSLAWWIPVADGGRAFDKLGVGSLEGSLDHLGHSRDKDLSLTVLAVKVSHRSAINVLHSVTYSYHQICSAYVNNVIIIHDCNVPYACDSHLKIVSLEQ